jgi:uncharacterized RDD family membrane protein YckC
MAAPGITVLKNNVPWGPFTRAQIEEGLARGDFTVKYLAHAQGLAEWLPLGEVIDYVDRHSGARTPSLPPVPGPRELPPIPQPVEAKPPPPAQPPGLPVTTPKPVENPPPEPAPIERIETKPERKMDASLMPAPFFLRAIAFLVDCAILFVPLIILYGLGGLCIEIAAVFHHIPHQERMEEWAFLNQNVNRLAWMVAVGFGWIYVAGFESSPSQATLGKRWMGIKVTDWNGERIGFLRATGRYAAKYLSALPCFLGFVAALFSSGNLALHDRLSDTRVVRN